jgi:hypothetical protein
MPIAILKYNLPEEQAEFNQACNAGKLVGALWNFSQNTLRQYRKHGHEFKTIEDTIEKIESEFWDNVNENGIDLDLL